MEIKEIDSGKLEKNFQVHIPSQTITDKIHAKAVEEAKTAKMDGFRVGKVPVEVIKSKLKDGLTKTVIDELISEVSQKIIEENKLKLSTRPNANITNFDETKGMEYTVKFELYPEVPAVDPSEFTLTQVICEVSYDDVAKVIEDLRKSKQVPTKAADSVKAALGNVVTIDFVGFMDGKEFEGGKAEGHKLELGSKRFIAGFEDALVGTKAGDNKKVKLKFPKDYHAKDFADKDVEFDVTVKEVATLTLPELTDEFASGFMAKDMEDLKSQIKAELTKRYNKTAFTLVKKDVLDLLDKKVSFDLPAAMVENELNGLRKQISSQNGGQEILDKDTKKFENIANRRVKLGFLLSDIAHANKLEITQSDLQEAILEYAKTAPGQETKIIEYFQKNPQAVDLLKGPIIEDKAIAYIISKAKTKDKKVTVEGLLELIKKAEEENDLV